MYYRSKLTKFCAEEPPYTDKIYYKLGNKTVCIIHIDENWNMYGEVLDPFNIPVDILNPKFRDLNQFECEYILLKDTPSPNRKDIKKKYNMKEIDYAKFMYCTRLINMLSNYWLAWSEDDKAEDYHPKFNKELLRQWDEAAIKLDWEPEDDEPPTPYWEPDPTGGIDYIPPENYNIPDDMIFGE